MMSFPEAVKICLRKYAVFSGRATRAEYWWWVLAVVIGSFISSFVDGFIGSLLLEGEAGIAFSFFQVIFTLATLLPGLAVTARRLHDIGKTGWWVLVWYGILFFLGWIPFAVGLGIVFFAVLSLAVGEFNLEGLFEGNFGVGEDAGLILFGLFTLLAGILVALAVTLGVLIWVHQLACPTGPTRPQPLRPRPPSAPDLRLHAVDSLPLW